MVFLKVSKFFLYLSLLTPLIVARGMFFPFVAGKAIYFRVIIELSLLFYLLYLLFKSRKFHYKTDENFQNKINRKFLTNPIFLAVAFFIFVVFLTSLTGVNPLNSLFSNFERGSGALQLLHYFIFFYLALSLLKTKKDWLNFVKFFLISSLFVSFYALGQLWQPQHSSHHFFTGGGSDRLSGTLGNPIYLANYLLFVYFFALYLIFNEKKFYERLFWIIYLTFQGVFFLFACTRSTTLGLILAIFAFSIFKIFELRKNNFRKILPYLLILILIIASGITFYFSQNHPFWKKVPCICRFTTSSKSTLQKQKELSGLEKNLEYRAPGISKRLWTWSSASAGFIEKPILGWGIENFPYLFDKYYSAKHFGNEPWFDRSHNLYLDYLTSGGILLLLSFLFIILAVIYQLSRTDNHNLSNNLKYLSFSLLIAYLTQAFFNFDDLSTYLTIFLFLAFLVFIAANYRALEKSNRRFLLVKNILLSFLVFSIIPSLCYLNLLPYQKNKLIVKALAYSRSPRKDLAFQNWENSLKYKSPVGQGENVKFFLSFVSDIFRNLVLKRKSYSPILSEEIKKLTYFSDELYQKNKKVLVGSQPLFSLSKLEVSSYSIIKDENTLNLAEQRIMEGRKIAPSRIIFLLLEQKIAEIKGDKKREKDVIEKIKFLRSDLTNKLKQLTTQ